MSEYYKSERIEGTKSMINLPGWARDMIEGTGRQKDTIATAAAALSYVPLVHRAVYLRADALSSVPVYFTKLDGETEVQPPLDVDWKDLIWKTEASLCTEGANFIEKIPRQMSRKVGGLEWINPTTMNKPELMRSKDGPIDYEFSQKNNPGTKWNLSTMIYMRLFSLADDVGPGVSSAKVALNDAALLRYVSRFAARFFEGGAMPITLASIPGLVDGDEVTRVEGFFKRAMTGLQKAWRVLAVRSEIDVKVLTQPLKDLAMPELNEQARHAVALAFGIPQTMLEDAANFATSKEHRLSFWQDTMQPRGDWIAEQFNRQLLADFKIQMRFGFEELDIFQEDENERAASLQSIVTAINTNPAVAKLAMQILGYDLNDELQKELDAIVNKPEPEPAAPPPEAGPPPAETVTETPAKVAWADDLIRWKNRALRVFGESGTSALSFKFVDNDLNPIPADVRKQVEKDLPQCKSEGEIRELFKSLLRIGAGTKTQTSVQEYRSDPGTTALAESINRLAEVYAKTAGDTHHALLMETIKAVSAPKEPAEPAAPIVVINNPKPAKYRRSLSPAQVFARDAFKKE